MKTNEMMSQEEVVKVFDDTKGFLENTFRLYLITNGVDDILDVLANEDLEDMDTVETLKLLKKGLALYYDFIDIMQTEAITVMDTNQKVNQMYEALLKNGQIEK